MTWTSDDPHLSGNFAPVQDELDVADLPVVAGRIPPELAGAYLRNGPNPAFEPLAYTFPFDGDGMIHGVYLRGGRASYRNRFVETAGLKAERRAGRALYGSLLQPRPVDPALIGPDGDPGPIKNGAYIHIIRHAGRLLALYEGRSAYELTPELATLGQWHAGAAEPPALGPHNRRHPASGDLYSVVYGVFRPQVLLKRIDRDGRLADSRTLDFDQPTMLHDFVLTERHAVILAGPVVFDMAAARAGGVPIAWRPELGTRIALVPLDGGPVRWLQSEACFVFHFANGFERQGRIELDYVRYPWLRFDGSADATPPGQLHRQSIDLGSGRLEERQMAPLECEFPRTDERLEALPTRYVYLPAPRTSGALTMNLMAKVDAETGRVTLHDFGPQQIGEAVFVPRPGGGGEDDGWLALFAYDPARNGSDFVLLDARDPAAPPVAVVRLPRRVPHGLHGSWLEDL